MVRIINNIDLVYFKSEFQYFYCFSNNFAQSPCKVTFSLLFKWAHSETKSQSQSGTLLAKNFEGFYRQAFMTVFFSIINIMSFSNAKLESKVQPRISYILKKNSSLVLFLGRSIRTTSWWSSEERSWWYF